jgi:hypothetical protein
MLCVAACARCAIRSERSVGKGGESSAEKLRLAEQAFQGTAEHASERQQVFAAALKRVNRELKRLHNLAARTAHVEAARKALALHETMNRGVLDLHAAQYHFERHRREGPTKLFSWKNEFTVSANLQRCHDLESASRQRHAVLATRLDPLRRYRPQGTLKVELFPPRAKHFARASSRQNGKFERKGCGRLT